MNREEALLLKKRLEEKFHPARHKLPQALAAVVGYIIDAPYCSPAIDEIRVRADGAVIATVHGQPPIVVGSYVDVVRVWLALIVAARLSIQERAEAEGLFAAKIGYDGKFLRGLNVC